MIIIFNIACSLVGVATGKILWNEPWYLWLALVDASIGILLSCLLLFFGVTTLLRKVGMRFMKFHIVGFFFALYRRPLALIVSSISMRYLYPSLLPGVIATVSAVVEELYDWTLVVGCIFFGRALLCTALAMHMYGPFLSWILKSSRLEAGLMGLARRQADGGISSVLQMRLEPWSLERFFFHPSPVFAAPSSTTASPLQRGPPGESPLSKISLQELANSIASSVFGERSRLNQREMDAEFQRATNVGVSKNVFQKCIDRDHDGFAHPADLANLYCQFFSDRKELYAKLHTVIRIL